VRVWEVTSGKELAHLYEFAGDVLGFLPDGKRLILGGSGVWIWDWSTNQDPELLAHPFTAPSVVNPARILSVGVTRGAVSDDGKTLAWIDEHGTVRLWDLPKKKEILRVPDKPPSTQPQAANYPLALSADAKFVALAGPGNVIRLWSIPERKETLKLQGHEGHVSELRFSPDGKFLASGSADQSLRIWALPNGKETGRVNEHALLCGAIDFSRDGRIIVSADGRGTIRVFSFPSAKLIRQFEGPRLCGSCITLTPDAKLLFAAGENEAVWCCDFETGKERHYGVGHRGRILSVAYSPDGRSLTTASSDGSVYQWDARSGEHLKGLEGHRNKIRLVTYAPDQSAVATGSDDGSVRIWRSKDEKAEILATNLGRIAQLAYCQGGNLLASAGTVGGVRVWKTSDGKEMYQIKRNRIVFLLAAGATGNELLIGSPEAVVAFNAEDGQELWRIPCPTEKEFVGMAASSDGRMLALATVHAEVGIYEVASGQLIQTVRTGRPEFELIGCLAFAGRGRVLAVANFRGLILCDLGTGKNTGLIPVNNCGSIFALAGSPDGRFLASGNGDSTAFIWKIPESFTLPLKNSRANELSNEQCEKLWFGLGDAKAREGYAAAWQLITCPEMAIKCFRQNLKPIAQPNPKALQADIAALADDKFSVREKAYERLKGTGELAVPLLKQRLAEKLSVDEQVQIEKLISLANATPSMQWKHIRALQVLETIHTDEAKELLSRMAKGAQHSRITQQATASLKRLDQVDSSHRQGTSSPSALPN
jgi:WD40 repeat protein